MKKGLLMLLATLLCCALLTGCDLIPFVKDYIADVSQNPDYIIIDNPGNENGGSENGGSENGGSENGGSENGGSENGGSENGGSENGGSENGGSENGGSENGGSENGGSENGGYENASAGLEYTISDDETYYIVSGIGTCSDSSIVIPSTYNELPVTHIDNWAFSGCSSLTSVTIPNSVTSIGNGAFEYCSSLTSITIPDSVTSIGNYAFRDCSSLTSITIPDSVTSIGIRAFEDCYSLTSVTIPDSVTSIGGYAFDGCSSLICNEYDNAYYLGNDTNPYVVLVTAKDTKITSCTIHNNTKIICYLAFDVCSSLTSVSIPDSVTSVGGAAFRGCSSLTGVYITDIAAWCGISFDRSYSNPLCYAHNLYLLENGEANLITELVIPDGVTSIGTWAFDGCSSITSITIPDSVTSIGSGAFECFSSLTSITIPDSVTSIGNHAFYDCSSLTSVTIPDSVTSIGSYTFYGCSTLTSITIPDSVTSISTRAFSGCSSLTSVTIPNSVTSIGDNAFDDCYKLVEVINHSSLNITKGSSGFGYLAYYAKEVHTGESKIVNQNGYLFYTFEDVNYLLGYTGNDIELILPDNYNGESYEIYQYAFYEHDNIVSIIIGNDVTSIGDYAFYYCYKLVEVINHSSLNITKGSSSFGYLAFYAKEVHTGESKIVNQNGYLFYTFEDVNYLLGYTGNDIELILPDNYNGECYEIYDYAFFNCSSLTSVTIPNSVTSIGYSAFDGCRSLTSVTIGNSVTSIGDYAFYNCSSLTSITIPDSVTSISTRAFSGCSSLTNIKFLGAMSEWNSIVKDYNWNYYTGNYTIYCTDGEIAKDGTVTYY